VALAPATVAAAPHRAGKPDLVVAAGDFARVTGAQKELNWFFRGRGYDLTWLFNTGADVIRFADPGLTNISGSRQSTTGCFDGVVMEWDLTTGDPAG